ncbi:MAG: WD40 repeat domain-containing protein [Cytophagaceae bacterium]|jgi:WD40 repeat protein|nr:WD40 repeat domain-containing protein [Cytophagaceae bacterium]
MTGIVVEKIGTLTGHRDCIYALEHDTDPRYFFSAGGDGMVVRWDIKNPADGWMLAKVEKSIYALQLVPQQNQLLIGENFEGIHLVSLEDKKKLASSRITEASIFDIKILHDLILVACGNGELVLLHYPDLSTIRHLPLSAASLRTIAISPDGTLAAIGGSDHFIRILDIRTLKITETFKAHENSIFSLQFSPDGTFLFSAGRDAHLKCWKVKESFASQQDIVAHMYAINHITYRKDGKLMATCSMDKSVKVWDTATMRLLKVIDKARHTGHATSVNKLLWSEYHDTLISCSDDRSISLWNIQLNT